MSSLTPVSSSRSSAPPRAPAGWTDLLLLGEGGLLLLLLLLLVQPAPLPGCSSACFIVALRLAGSGSGVSRVCGLQVEFAAARRCRQSVGGEQEGGCGAAVWFQPGQRPSGSALELRVEPVRRRGGRSWWSFNDAPKSSNDPKLLKIKEASGCWDQRPLLQPRRAPAVGWPHLLDR